MSNASRGLAGLHPACFAMVMATGIVAIAAHLIQMRWIAIPLFWLNLVFYVTLWLLTLARLAWHRKEFVADLADHNRSVGFLTTVAGTCVLGNQFVVVVPVPEIALVLWWLGIILWAFFTYSILTILTIKSQKPSLAEGINGGWLTVVVAAQAVSALGGLLVGYFDAFRQMTLFFTLVMWLGGAMLYVWIVALIFYRYTFFPLNPAAMTPPYWINMGAMAISTLAGTLLIENAAHWSLLSDLLPFLKGATLLFWSTATWWIPMLILLGIWRHVYSHYPLAYDVMYWSAVFPLGMYTASTIRLSQTLDVPFLMVIPRVFIYIALAAWLATAIAMVVRLLYGARTA